MLFGPAAELLLVAPTSSRAILTRTWLRLPAALWPTTFSTSTVPLTSTLSS